MEHVREYIEEHKDRFLEELFGLIRIPSISSEADKKEDMIRAAEYWKKVFGKLGQIKLKYSRPKGTLLFTEKR